MKPVNRTKQKKNYLLMGVGIYALIIYVFLHLGHVLGGEDRLSPEILIAAIDHCVYHPLDIFPINTEYLTKGAFVGAIAPLLLHSEYLRRRDLRPSIENGSAKWSEDLKKYNQKFVDLSVKWPKIFDTISIFKKLKAFLISLGKKISKIPLIGALWKAIEKNIQKNFSVPTQGAGSKNMIFTKEVFLSMDTRKTRRNNNVLVIGGSGTGKSRFLVKPNALQGNCSMIFTDPSGELLESLGVFLEQQGYEIRVFNLVQMEHSNSYNPFHYIRNQEGVLIMINTLIKNTTPKGSSSSDPFWEKAETALLQAICFFLVSECNEEDQNFSSVMRLLRCAEAIEGKEDQDSTLDVLFNDLKAREPEHIAVQSYAVFKSAGGGKTAQSILISCQTRLQTFNLDAIKKLTDKDNIDLGSVGDKKVALFCITPSADTTFNYLVALLYSQLFETLYHHAETECKGKRLPYHVRFLLDEFANVGTIPDFSQKLATMRKYEISCTIIIQALSQLKSMYKDDWEVLVGNCDSCLFLGGSDATSLEYISKKLGKETIRTVNNSRSYGKQGSHSMSYNKAGRELMTTDELGVMDNENCVLFIRGLYPFFGTKYPLEKHPNYPLSGDAKDENIYNVQERLSTGQEKKKPNVTAQRAKRIHNAAQRSDTRTADREHRQHSVAPQTRSARNRPLLQPAPVTDIIPAAAKEPEEFTSADRKQLENLELVKMSDMTEEQLSEFQYRLQERYFGTPPDDGTPLDASESIEDSEPTDIPTEFVTVPLESEDIGFDSLEESLADSEDVISQEELNEEFKEYM